MKLYKPIFWEKKNSFMYLLLLLLITFFVNQAKKWQPKKFKIKTICVEITRRNWKTSLQQKYIKFWLKNIILFFIKKKHTNYIDEINQLKKGGNIIFKEDREESLSLAIKKKFDVAILDDGLQQKNLYYDLSIICFNSKNGLGNKFLIPSGPLRENFSEIKNYDVVFINGEDNNTSLKKIIKKTKKKIHIFEAKNNPINLKQFNLKNI